MSDFDVVVIGGGAAGLSAAQVLAQAQRRVAVVDSGAPRNAPANHVHGFLSRDGMPPKDLLALGRREVATYGGEIIDGSVAKIERGSGHWFRVWLADGSELTARRLAVTTGLRDQLPEIPGLEQRWGRDVLHCPYCHGYEVRDAAVGVLGGTSRAMHQVQLIREWATDVVFFPHTTALTADQREQLVARGIRVVDGAVQRLQVTDDQLAGIVIDGGHVIDRSALFVSPHFVPNSELLVDLGCDVDEYGWVLAHASGRTSVPGVWVAGNVSDPRAQVITAAGEGCTIAINLNWDLVEEDIHREVRALREAAG